MQEFLNLIISAYGGAGLVIVGLLYAIRVLWKDNVDLRARNDKLTDRFLTISALSVGAKPENHQ